jgi:hypothetical protein
MKKYERPKIVDYGSLVQLTLAGNAPNADVPHGNDGTAYYPS